LGRREPPPWGPDLRVAPVVDHLDVLLGVTEGGTPPWPTIRLAETGLCAEPTASMAGVSMVNGTSLPLRQA
jgi:hypothetical protein